MSQRSFEFSVFRTFTWPSSLPGSRKCVDICFSFQITSLWESVAWFLQWYFSWWASPSSSVSVWPPWVHSVTVTTLLSCYVWVDLTLLSSRSAAKQIGLCLPLKCLEGRHIKATHTVWAVNTLEVCVSQQLALYTLSLSSLGVSFQTSYSYLLKHAASSPETQTSQ